MQILAIVKTASLALAFGSGLSMGAAVATEDPRALANAPLYSELVGRQFTPLIPGLQGVLEYASQTLAYQIIGAAANKNQLTILCNHGDPQYTRLRTEGYDADFIKKAICDASNLTALQSNAEIQAEVTFAASKIWTVQALGSMLGFQNQLCNIFNVEAADRVGLNGTFVKNELCGAGG